MTFKYPLFLYLLFSFAIANAQEVSVSKEFNLRNDYSYEILGNVGDHIVLLRDQGLEYSLEVLGNDLSFKKTVEIQFEKSKIELIGVVNRNEKFTIYYSFKDEGNTHISSRSYNQKVEPVDTTLLFREKTKVFKQLFDIAVSEDNSKVLVYNRKNKNELNIIAIDQDSVKVLYDDIISFEEYDLRTDFREIIINNSAEAFILLNKNNSKGDKENNIAEVNYVSPYTDLVESFQISLSDIVVSDMNIFFDNKKDNILVAGLYHEKNKTASQGYFAAKTSKHQITPLVTAEMSPYTMEVLEAVYGKKIEKDLQNFKISNVVFRNDGGFLLITEMNKELARRTYYNGTGRFNNYNNNQGIWKDYYNEHIIMFAVKPSGIEHWAEVLHKKQFSQDDNNIYGSFFMYKSPSRLRLIYNDEIKKNNTVSEYVINPIGEFERNAVLSTDYQDLSLRFRDALQLSATELLVPSQRNYRLNLVKIKYN